MASLASASASNMGCDYSLSVLHVKAKRIVAFVEWATVEVLEEVDYRQLVWTIPKALRSACHRDRKLLGERCRCAWQTLRESLEAVLGPGYTVGVICALQAWGDTKLERAETDKVTLPTEYQPSPTRNAPRIP